MSQQQWTLPEPVLVPEPLRTFVGGHPLVAELLYRRGITTLEQARAFLNPDAYTPASPLELPGMQRAVERLLTARTRGEKVCVWGDFDVDGQTATTLLVSALRQIGLTPDYYIPNRSTEGHGIALEKLKTLIASGVQLILTCDTGIAEHEAIAYAQAQGVDVVFTDHHQLPDQLPNAYVCVNPQMLPAEHPLHTLPGVGVAHKLIEALYDAVDNPPDTTQFLDLVALGIVADVAVLRGDTRYLLQCGLRQLRDPQRTGLIELYKLAELVAGDIDEEDIGFVIGPRLNALGRLDDANVAVKFLTTTDLTESRILANRLDGLNRNRRQLTQQVTQAAEKQIETDPNLLKYQALVLAHPEWPDGIIGIVANKLVEKYQRPVVLLKAPPGGIAHGSARSVAGCNITECIASHSQMLKGYGGHTMAAGLQIETDRIPAFRQALSHTIGQVLASTDQTTALNIDCNVMVSDLTLDLHEDMGRLAPFGSGHPRPIFALTDLTLRSTRQLGRSGDHIRFTVADSGAGQAEITWWNAEEGGAVLPTHLDLAVTLHKNTYRGKTDLLIQYLTHRPAESPEEAKFTPANITIKDYRQESDSMATLRRLMQSVSAHNICIWSEGYELPDLTVQHRLRLHPADILCIWTLPPTSDALHAAIAAVQPNTLWLFAEKTRFDDVQPLLKQLTGLVKYAINKKDGIISLEEFAALTGQTPEIIHTGLNWLQAQGRIALTERDDNKTIKISAQVATPKRNQVQTIETRLQQLMHEVAAYRSVLTRTLPGALTKDSG